MESLFIKIIALINDNWKWLGPIFLIFLVPLAFREVFIIMSEEFKELLK